MDCLLYTSYLCFIVRVGKGGGLVQDQDGRIFQHGTGNGNALLQMCIRDRMAVSSSLWTPKSWQRASGRLYKTSSKGDILINDKQCPPAVVFPQMGGHSAFSDRPEFFFDDLAGM